MPTYDLGKTYDCPEVQTKESPSVHYPSLYIEDVDLGELPDKGEATIKFRVVRKTKDMKNKKSSAELEILSITSYADGDDDKGKDELTDKVLDRLRAEIEAKES